MPEVDVSDDNSYDIVRGLLCPPIRKVINGRVYDTDTAEHVAWLIEPSWEKHENRLRAVRSLFAVYGYVIPAAIFRTKRGAWFLAGYHEESGCLRAALVLISDDQARKALEIAEAENAILHYFAVEEG